MFFWIQDGKWNIEDEPEESQDENEDDEDEEEEEGDEDEGEEEEGSSDEEEEEDGDSDLESENGSEDEERSPEDKDKSSKPLSQEEIKAQQDAAKSELPYTFAGTCTPGPSERRPPARVIYRLWRPFSLAAPESLSELTELLRGHTPDNQRLILARTLKCNHPSLAVGNKLKLQVYSPPFSLHFIVCFCSAGFTPVILLSSETLWLSVGVRWRSGLPDSA